MHSAEWVDEERTPEILEGEAAPSGTGYSTEPRVYDEYRFGYSEYEKLVLKRKS